MSDEAQEHVQIEMPPEHPGDWDYQTYYHPAGGQLSSLRHGCYYLVRSRDEDGAAPEWRADFDSGRLHMRLGVVGDLGAAVALTRLHAAYVRVLERLTGDTAKINAIIDFMEGS